MSFVVSWKDLPPTALFALFLVGYVKKTIFSTQQRKKQTANQKLKFHVNDSRPGSQTSISQNAQLFVEYSRFTNLFIFYWELYKLVRIYGTVISANSLAMGCKGVVGPKLVMSSGGRLCETFLNDMIAQSAGSLVLWFGIGILSLIIETCCQRFVAAWPKSFRNQKSHDAMKPRSLVSPFI